MFLDVFRRPCNAHGMQMSLATEIDLTTITITKHVSNTNCQARERSLLLITFE